jgi:small subunit ribosomal protein S17
MTEADTKKRNLRKQRTGRAVKDAVNKTVVVLVETKKQHPLYGKTVRQSKKLHVHDEENSVKAGDLVVVAETPPHSKMYRWRRVEFTPRAGMA